MKNKSSRQTRTIRTNGRRLWLLGSLTEPKITRQNMTFNEHMQHFFCALVLWTEDDKFGLWKIYWLQIVNFTQITYYLRDKPLQISMHYGDQSKFRGHIYCNQIVYCIKLMIETCENYPKVKENFPASEMPQDYFPNMRILSQLLIINIPNGLFCLVRWLDQQQTLLVKLPAD